MIGKYHLLTLEPNIDTTPGTTHGGTDIVFGWQAVEIPRGACMIKTISATVVGLNGAADNTFDMQLYYARSINGVAPTTFGTENAVTATTTTVDFRRNILGFTHIDASSIDDADVLRAYNVFGSRSASGGDSVADGGYNSNVILQGDLAYPSTKGYQTIWIAGAGRGAFDFGTDVALNMGGNQAASTAAVQITTDGTDPRIVFGPGDQVIGDTGGPTMEVVSADSATTMTVKTVSEQIDDDEELVHRNPMKFMIGLEY